MSTNWRPQKPNCACLCRLKGAWAQAKFHLCLLAVYYYTSIVFLAPPLNISITQVTPYTVSLSWAPPPARGSGKVKGYVISVGRIKRKPGGSVQNVSTSNTSKTISGLSADTKYELRVSTKTHTGVGAFSEPVIFRTKIYGKLNNWSQPHCDYQ